MKNLLLFFNNIKFFLFFLLLQLIAFVVIRSNSSYQQASILNSSSRISGWMYQQKKTIADYFSLKQENNTLATQNAKLKQESINNYTIISNDEIEINDEKYKRQYLFQPSVVVHNSIKSRENILTIGAGKNKGLKPEMGVISSKGVVGFSRNVSKHYSTVMSMMNKNFRIPVKPLKDSCVGILSWLDGDKINEISVKGIPTYFKIKKGDTIVTQGGSGMFPEGEIVGFVTKIFNVAGSNNMILKLKTSVDFYSLNHIFVIKNIYKEELDSSQDQRAE